MIYEVGMNTQCCSCQMRPDHRHGARMTVVYGRRDRRGKIPLIGGISCQEVETLFLQCTLSASYNCYHKSGQISNRSLKILHF